jgi:hypothetical protein
MTLAVAEAALRNWGAWCTDTADCYPEGARCVSLESQWRSPQVWESPEPRLDINERLAESVEDYIHWDTFPALWRKILKAQYVTYPEASRNARRPDVLPIRARAAGVSERTFEDQLQLARHDIAEWLGGGN